MLKRLLFLMIIALLCIKSFNCASIEPEKIDTTTPNSLGNSKKDVKDGFGGGHGGHGGGHQQQSHNKNKHNKKQKGLMEKILPMMVIPFLISTAIIPKALIMLKIFLIKAFIVGKIAIILGLINMFRTRLMGGGVFNHEFNEKNDMAMAHYGYNGDDEYGAYIHN